MKYLFLLLVILAGCYSEPDRDTSLYMYDAYMRGTPREGCMLWEGDSNTEWIPMGRFFQYGTAYNIAVYGSGTEDCINRLPRIREIKD